MRYTYHINQVYICIHIYIYIYIYIYLNADGSLAGVVKRSGDEIINFTKKASKNEQQRDGGKRP